MRRQASQGSFHTENAASKAFLKRLSCALLIPVEDPGRRVRNALSDASVFCGYRFSVKPVQESALMIGKPGLPSAGSGGLAY